MVIKDLPVHITNLEVETQMRLKAIVLTSDVKYSMARNHEGYKYQIQYEHFS